MSNGEPGIRVLTIGTSIITTAFADAVAQTDGIRIEGVFSRDGARAADKAAEFGAPLSFDSLDEALASPHIDAVYIASPNAAHADQAVQAIDAGKHVIVEKPAVLTADEWVALVARAQDAGVVLLEALRTEYDPGTAVVRELLAEIGVPRSATLRYQRRSSRYDLVLAGERVNMFDPALGGGALNDLGVYVIHAMVTLFGVPQTVSAASVSLPTGVDGAGSILAEYPGLVVDLAYSKITTSHTPSEIQGEEGTLVIDDVAGARLVELVRRDGTRDRREIDLGRESLVGEVERFVALVTRGGDAARDHALTEQTLRIIEQARTASR